jgi:hypothetical protein
MSTGLLEVILLAVFIEAAVELTKPIVLKIGWVIGGFELPYV